MEIDRFLSYIQYEKRASEHTLAAYRTDLKQYVTYLEAQQWIAGPTEHDSSVGHSHIRSWVVELMQLGRKPQSIRRKLATLKSYYRFLLEKQVITQNPMRKVQLPRVGRTRPDVVPAEQMERVLLDHHFTDDYKGLRDRLVLEILYGTGMRRGELLRLTLADARVAEGVFSVTGKGGKQRLLPFYPGMREVLEAYLECRASEHPAAGDALLLTDKGKPLYPKAVYNIVQRHLSLVPHLERRSPHILRHSFATHLMDGGADLNALKDLMGHSSLAATQLYTHTTPDKLRKAYEQAHPKGRGEREEQ